MTILAARRPAVGAQVPVTPTIRSATRRWIFWLVAVGFVVILGVVGILINGTATIGTPFSATNAAPGGSEAIARVLTEHGVDVDVPGSFAATRSALDTSHDATLFLYDPQSLLNESQLESLAGRVDSVVVLTPTFSQLDALAPTLAAAGVVSKKRLTAGCSLPAARNAGTVTGTGSGYRVTDSGSDPNSCFGSADRVFSVIQTIGGRSVSTARVVTVVGTTDALTNEHVAENGNAALALTLLGSHHTLVWYLPTIADAGTSGKSIGQLSPAWVGSVATLLILVAITAAFWRGRRFGALIIENLPVVVRASETMEGRARLYQKGAARLHALDALRIGAIDRLAATCGLPRVATVDEVIAIVAAVSARDPADIRDLLVDTRPTNDRDLVRLSDALLELERTVATDVLPR